MVSYLHHDPLGSVDLITAPDGAGAREVAYWPYGQMLYASGLLPATPPEARGYIGERFEACVGTNRTATAGGDPVNGGEWWGAPTLCNRSFKRQT